MGVKRLWNILSPAGRQVSIETLSGKVLAVDASIWLTQFVKSMRDDEGRMLPNAHILGVFRRLCKLLFHRIKPVFVFDGGTPALKRKEVLRRRDARVSSDAARKAAARRLLLNKLHQMALKDRRLKRLAAKAAAAGQDGEDQAPGAQEMLEDHAQDASIAAGFTLPSDQGSSAGSESDEDVVIPKGTTATPASTKSTGNASDGTQGQKPSSMPADEAIFDSESGGEADFVDDTVAFIPGISAQPPVSGPGWEYRRGHEKWNPNAPDDAHTPALNMLKVGGGGFDLDAVMALPPAMREDYVEQIRKAHRSSVRSKVMAVASNAQALSSTQLDSFLAGAAVNVRLAAAQRANAKRVSKGTRIAGEADKEFVFRSAGHKAASQPVPGGATQASPASEAPTPICAQAGPQPASLLDEVASVVSSDEDTEAGGGGEGEQPAAARADEEATAAPERTTHSLGQGKASPGAGSETESEDEAAWDVASAGGSEATVESVEGGAAQEDQWKEAESLRQEAPASTASAVGLPETSAGQAQHAPASPVRSSGTAQDRNHSHSTSTVHVEGAREQGERLTISVPAPAPNAEAGVEAEAPPASQVSVEAGTPFATQPSQIIPPASAKSSFTPPAARSRSPASSHVGADLRGASNVLAFATQASSQVSLPHAAVHRTAERSDSRPPTPPAVDTSGISMEVQAAILADLGVSELETVTLSRLRPGSDKAVSGALVEDAASDSGWSDASEAILHAPDSGVVDLASQDVKPKSPSASAAQDVSADDKGAAQAQDEGSDAMEHALKTASGMAGWAERALRRAMRKPVAQRPAADQQTTAVPDGAPEHRPPPGSAGDGSGSTPPPHTTSPAGPPEVARSSPGPVPLPSLVRAGTAAEDESALRQLQAEEAELQQRRKKGARDAEGVSDDMQGDIIRLLRIMGVPYLVAPMEAEAQCAELERLGLVQGTITDDSDAFLFGSTRVYRNIFRDGKYVEEYAMEAVTSELGLTRDMLVRSALLLGSDYTRGIKGVGEVNTLEILSAFPGDQGLRTFAEWLQGLYKARELEELASLKPTKKQVAELDPAMRFMYTHRSARTKWSAPSEFPSRMVMQAYLRPTVSSSTEPFTWTLPQVDPIKALCANAFGWDAQTTESHINPVLSALTKGSGQSSLHQFFITKYDDGVRAAAVRSSRMRTALKGLHGREDDSDIAISAQKASRGTKRPADLDMQELDDAQLAGLDLELAANGSTPPRATPARSKRSRA